MSNTYMTGLRAATNYGYTENGNLTHISTNSDLLDMFAMGGAMRSRGENDIIIMFQKAFMENPEYAMKCLFYLRDVRGGQGERRFFRIILCWMADNEPDVLRRNLEYVPMYGRWDDLYALLGTSMHNDALALIKHQLAHDVMSDRPSLAAKWLASENASSRESRERAIITRNYLGWDAKTYRKVLSTLRARIKLLETQMSENKWNEIQFDSIPSKAGMKYQKAFIRHEGERYREFMANKDTKVNADVLNPVDIAHQIFSHAHSYNTPSQEQRLAWDKYWANLKDYYNGRVENGIAVVDVSGSMNGVPLEAAVSMGAYIAERGKGPFQNHFITFSRKPSLVRFEGVDTYDKFKRARWADWGMNTDINKVLELILNTAIATKATAEEMPERLYIFSDMEFDEGMAYSGASLETTFENMKRVFASHGYRMPSIVFWNLNARHNNIPAIGEGFSYISGFSMTTMEAILSGKDGVDLMYEVLNSERYAPIH